jgi:hypothetical protein
MRKSNWTPSIVPNGGGTIAVAGMYTFAEAVCHPPDADYPGERGTLNSLKFSILGKACA